VHALGSGYRPWTSPSRVGSQLGRPLQERGGRRDAAAAPRPVGRTFQLAGDRLVGSWRRLCTMPRSAIGLELRIRSRRQCAMHLLAVMRGR